MKNTFLLLISGVGLALIAWGIWHFLGDNALNAITTLALLVVVADNLRLRRQLRSQQAK